MESFNLSFEEIEFIVSKTEKFDKVDISVVVEEVKERFENTMFGMALSSVVDWKSFMGLIAEFIVNQLQAVVKLATDKKKDLEDPISKKMMKEPISLKCNGQIVCKIQYMKFFREKGKCFCGRCKVKNPDHNINVADRNRRILEELFSEYYDKSIKSVGLVFRFVQNHSPSEKFLNLVKEVFHLGVDLVKSRPNIEIIELYEKFCQMYPDYADPRVLNDFRQIYFDTLVKGKQWHLVFPYFQKHLEEKMDNDRKENLFLRLLQRKKIAHRNDIRKALLKLYEETNQIQKILGLIRSALISNFDPEIISNFLGYLKGMDETTRKNEIENILKYCDNDEKKSAFLTPTFEMFPTDNFVSNYVMKLYMTQKSQEPNEEEGEGEESEEGEEINQKQKKEFKKLFSKIEGKDMNTYLLQFLKQVTVENESLKEENRRINHDVKSLHTKLESLQKTFQSFMTKTVQENLDNRKEMDRLTRRTKDVLEMPSLRNYVEKKDMEQFRRSIMEDVNSKLRTSSSSTSYNRPSNRPVRSRNDDNDSDDNLGYGRSTGSRYPVRSRSPDNNKKKAKKKQMPISSGYGGGRGYGKPRDPVETREKDPKRYGRSATRRKNERAKRIDEIDEDEDESEDDLSPQLSTTKFIRSKQKQKKKSTITSSSSSTRRNVKSRLYDSGDDSDDKFTPYSSSSSRSKPDRYGGRRNRRRVEEESDDDDDDDDDKVTLQTDESESSSEEEEDRRRSRRNRRGDDRRKNKKKKKTPQKLIKSQPSPSSSGKKQRSVIVTFISGSIPKKVSKENIRAVFRSCGVVEFIYFEPHMSYVLVVFYDERGAQNAVKTKNGKKHCGQEMMCQISDRVGVEVQIGNTIIVEGLKPENDEEQIRNVFEQVCGKDSILEFRMEGNSRKCLIKFANSESRDKSFQLDGTKVSKAAMDIYPVTTHQGRAGRYSREDFGVIIAGLERYTMKRDIKKFCRSCGKVMRIDFNPSKDTAFVDFQTTNAVEAALEKTGRKLKNKRVTLSKYTIEAHKDHMNRKGRFRRR